MNKFFTLLLINQLIFFVCQVISRDGKFLDRGYNIHTTTKDFIDIIATNLVPASSKIVGGQPITIDKAPYQVWIGIHYLHRQNFGHGLFCGGTIISQSAVLSAAHCFYFHGCSPSIHDNSKFYIVIAGSASFLDIDETTQTYLIRKIVPHERYSGILFQNDIALVFLKGFIPWNSTNVQPIALAKRRPEVHEICQISGWGSTLANDGDLISFDPEYSPDLRQANIPIRSSSVCRDTFGLLFTNYELCAGYDEGKIDTCQGDSGGPLICSNQLAGITSYGYGCAQPDTPGVYTDVSAFIDWIEKVNRTYAYGNSAFISRISKSLQILCLLYVLCG